ncbi:MAG: hypothetical protein ACRDIW_00600 [Actinomycetota bacterium]
MADDLDALFALPPEEFTAARDRLAKAIEDRGAARAVKAFRRPTVAAWAVNQTVRRHRDALERLLTAGREVRAAQRRAASGLSAPAFGKAIAERRRLVGELTDLAAAVLTEAGRAPEPQTRAIANTFEAAAADDSAAEAVAEGRLSKELTPPTGFEILGGFELVEGQGEAAEEPGSERPDPAVARAARQAEKWRTRLATAREELRAARRAAGEAARHVADLERDLARARGEAESAEAKRARIERRAEEAERKLEEASGGEP